MTVVAAAILLAAASPMPKPLSDAALKAYAARPLDESRINAVEVIGTHRGTRVIAETHCSDLCPAYTVRIVHYDVPPGDGCKRIDGVTTTVSIPMGIAAMPRKFCVPRLLSANAVRHY